jgi:hypothetical protein
VDLRASLDDMRSEYPFTLPGLVQPVGSRFDGLYIPRQNIVLKISVDRQRLADIM